jgi:hypothetical protein
MATQSEVRYDVSPTCGARLLLTVENAGWRSADIDEGVNRLSYEFATSGALEAFRTRAAALGVPPAALILKVENGVRWPVH